MMSYTILYYTTLYYTILYYTILHYTILYYTILYYTIRRQVTVTVTVHTSHGSTLHHSLTHSHAHT